jgi:cytochrome c oxidase assembly protein subunit 15
MPRRLTSFQRLAVATTAATYLLILVGGLVRASGAGLGCPDWPRCFGGWFPPASAAELPSGFDQSQFNLTLMWTEYLNRLLGVTVGFLILGTVMSAWRHHRRRPTILWPSAAALVLTGFEGWLGGVVVAKELEPWVVTAHLVVALVIVQLLLYATFQAFAGTSRAPVASQSSSRFARAVQALIAVTLVQITLGTQVRGRVDDALAAGTARDAILATAGWIEQLHRDAALLVFGGTLVVMLMVWWTLPGRRVLARWAVISTGLAAAQVALGIVMAYVSLVPPAQVLHLTVASLLLGAETVLLLIVRTGEIEVSGS